MVEFYKLFANLCHSLKTHKHPAPKSEKSNNFFTKATNSFQRKGFCNSGLKTKSTTFAYNNK